MMKKLNKFLLFGGVFFAALFAAGYLGAALFYEDGAQGARDASAAGREAAGGRPVKTPIFSAGQNRKAPRVPAHHQSAPKRGDLRPTLDPHAFTGRIRDAYRAVGEIPEIIAQIPCFCYCDEGFGHQSLHSCFEDEHGSRCPVCINEALAAYRLHSEQNLDPDEIRARIIAQYTE